jgi:hypothetical protein
MTSDPLEYPGIDNSREFAEWLWDSGFAAVCTDSPGFEAMRMYSNNHQKILVSVLTYINSPPRLFPPPGTPRRLWDAHRRAVCPGRTGGAVREDRAGDLFFYE